MVMEDAWCYGVGAQTREATCRRVNEISLLAAPKGRGSYQVHRISRGQTLTSKYYDLMVSCTATRSNRNGEVDAVEAECETCLRPVL